MGDVNEFNLKVDAKISNPLFIGDQDEDIKRRSFI